MCVVFLYGTTPREFLHDLFAQHHDTVEHTHKVGECEISNVHTHCAFLGIIFTPFLSAEKEYLAFEHISYHVRYIPAGQDHYSFLSYKVAALRGPPIA